MKKSFLALASLVSITTASSAQTLTTIQLLESTVSIAKTDRFALSGEYDMSSDELKNALKEFFRSKGIRLEKSKGLLIAKRVTLLEMGNNTYDLYFDVESKGNSPKNKSINKIAVSSGYDNFISPADTEVYSQEKNYIISSLNPSLYAEKRYVDVSAQTQSIAKAQKKYNNLITENQKLEKHRKNIEADIAENKRNQEFQLKEIERQKATLDLLKADGGK